MELMRFKPGQKVVCVRPNSRYTIKSGPRKGLKHRIGPRFNEIVTIASLPPGWAIKPGQVLLAEYMAAEMSYDEKYFEPLISDAVLAKELSEIEQPKER
jgi:hypothetical protein